MIRILTSEQIRQLDAYTIANEPIPSIELMERASKEFVQWFVQHVDATKKIGIICGTGNNGGDGLAVARLLHDWGYPVKVWIVRGPVRESTDFAANFERLHGKVETAEITDAYEQTVFNDRDVLIDAIFGSGLSRPVEGLYAQVIRCMNSSDALRIAIDIPSGLRADQASSGEIVRAHYTVTFQLPKLAFLLPGSFPYTGKFVTVDIGLDKDFIRSSETDVYYVNAKAVRSRLKIRNRFAHKGDFGHALLVAGSRGKIGAAVLSSRAAIRAGLGLLTVHIPRVGYDIIQTTVPEAMASVDNEADIFSEVTNLDKYDVVGIGPGLGQDPKTKNGLSRLLKDFRKPMVLDADALNIIAANPQLRGAIPENSILTPHPKEFERLAGKWKDDFERLQLQREMATALKVVILVKGGYTTIASPDGKLYFNPTGNPGMATGGTGDVLTGILTGLLAQGYSAKDAVILGVYLHGLAGDLAVVDKGQASLMASDLVEFLPQAFLKMARNKV